MLATTTDIQDILPHNHELSIWTHVDPGSNVHIVFEKRLLHNYRSTKEKFLGQVSGDKIRVVGMGEWHIRLHDKNIVLHNVLYMPSNPTCTLSTGALKLLDGFTYSGHDALAKLHLKSPQGVDYVFTTKRGNMRNINGLDYVLLSTILPVRKYPTVPNPSSHPDDGGYISANAASLQPPRRSKRLTKLPLRYRTDASQSPSPPRPPSHLSVSTPVSRIPSKPPSVISISTPPIIDDSSTINSPYLTTHISSTPHRPSLPVSSPSSPSPPANDHLQSVLTHLKFGFRNMKNILHMKKHSSLKNLPSKLQELPFACPICVKCNQPRLRRNPPLPINMLRPGQMLQMDFAFFNVQSVRGFTSYLSCDCVLTKYSFRFCTRRKRSPVDIIRWILLTLKKQNKIVIFVRFDEGGELARCTELNKLLVEDFQIVMQSTGGYASHLNGVTERGHRSDANTIRTSLYAAGLEDKYWCFALMHSNFLNRRWCRYPETSTPYEKWNNTKPSFNKLHVFGATIYVHNHQAKRLQPKSDTGIYLGFGASTAVFYYLDPILKTIKRAHNTKIDDLQIGGNDLTPGSRLIHQHGNLSNLRLPTSSITLATVASPFDYATLFTYQVTITRTGPLGLNLENDEVFGLPIINFMQETSLFRVGCKKNLQKNAWLIGVHHDEPITIQRFLEYVEFLRETNILTFQITLTKRIDPSATDYQLYCTYFDNFRPIAAKGICNSPRNEICGPTPYNAPYTQIMG